MTPPSQTGAVTTIRVDGISAGWEQWILFQSDQHFDSVVCNRELLTEHLDEARRRNAWIISTGDFVDAMQGRFDPRRSMAELRPEYRRDDYYDFVVQDAVNYLLPYRANLKVLGDGNHELSVLKNANTNLADRIVSGLRQRGSEVVHGGFGGWVVILLKCGTDGPKFAKRIKYYHGSGGEAPVTRGAIQTNRQAVYLPDADIVVNGHSHNAYVIPISRERITVGGRQYMDVVYYIRTPGYKQSYADGSGGWDVTRGGVPKPIGAMWCKLSYHGGDVAANNHGGYIRAEITPDVRGAEVVSPCGDACEGAGWGEDDRLT